MLPIYILLEPVADKQKQVIDSSERVLEITTSVHNLTRSSELHLDSSMNCKLAVAGVTRHNIPAEALASAKRGSRTAFNLLVKEGYLDRKLRVAYRLPSSAKNQHGFSSDLSFALALITHAPQFKRINFPAIVASGVVNGDGSVQRVEHVEGKLNSALEKLPKDAHIFLSKANQADVPAALSYSFEERNITLHFIDWLEEACTALGIQVRKLYRDNPFRGLEAFELEHRSLYFGREEDIEKAVAQFKVRQQLECPSLLILGASGSGKSSFVQAALLHELIYGDLLPADHQIRYSVFRPRQLLERVKTEENYGYFSPRLTETLCKHWELSLEVPISDDFLTIPAAIDALLQAIKKSPRKVSLKQSTYIWIIDQLEELFTLGWDDQEVQTFVELLTDLPRYGVCVFATLSSDFYANYQNHTGLFNHFKEGGHYDLVIPDGAALSSIVREPARLAELSFQNKNGINLDDQILNDAGVDSSVLPLLEFTLSQLYQERDKNQSLLTYSAYEKIGGVQGAIGAWAQNVYETLPVEQQKPRYLQTLIRRLAVVESDKGNQQVASTKEFHIAARAVPMESLPSYIHPLVRSLTGAKARLLMLEKDAQGKVVVRVTHEALLRNWPLVTEQIERDQEQLVLLQQLTHQQQRWQYAKDNEQDDFLIPDGVQLKQAKVLESNWGEVLPEEIGSYINDSYRKSYGRRRKLLLLAGVSTVVFLVVLDGFLWTRKHELPISSIITLQKFRLGYESLPEMIDIKAPEPFLMGEEDKNFIQQKNIPKERYINFGYPPKPKKALEPFAIGKYEVTYEEFDFFVWSQQKMDNTKLSYPATSKGGRGKHPAGSMTWNEAHDYSQWLGDKTNKACRLPTEQEWEFAAKAGTHTGYPWGNDVRKGDTGAVMANCPGCGSQWDRIGSAPVGQFPPNNFGVYDMNGNVWEMTSNLWPPDTALGSSDEELRVVRGGSYFDDPAMSRSSARFNKVASQRHYHIGFRIVCNIPRD